MKIRQARKIMKKCQDKGIARTYWQINGVLYVLNIVRDHRITKAMILAERWNARRYRNEAAKLSKKNPFRPRDLRRSVERLKQYSV